MDFEQLLNRRGDFSPFLIHLTRASSDDVRRRFDSGPARYMTMQRKHSGERSRQGD